MSHYEGVADLGVCEAARHQRQDLTFPRRQLVELGRGRVRGLGEALNDTPSDRRIEQSLTASHDSDRMDQMLGRGVLQQKAAGPSPQRFEDVLVEIERRE